MTEFAIILPVLLLLILGALQVIFIYQAKTTLNYATYEAARAGALEHAQLDPIQHGFSRGMAPFFTRPASDDDTLKSTAAMQGRDVVREQIRLGRVRFERINPTRSSFDTFGQNSAGLIEIPNNHLLFRDAGVIDANGLSVQDANLLKVRITYCMDLIVPFANRIIESSASALTGSSSANDFERQCMGDDDSTRLPITSFAIMRMQSTAQSCPGCFANTSY